MSDQTSWICNQLQPPHTWQTTVRVEPLRLHVLSNDAQSSIEAIDF